MDVSSVFPDPGYNVDNFKTRAIVAVKFQILSPNFKPSKKIDIVKAYLFRLLKVYLIDDPIYSTMSTLNKRLKKEEKEMVTLP